MELTSCLMSSILLTGASGFVGQELLKHLLASPQMVVTAAVRRSCHFPDSVRQIPVGDISGDTDWQAALHEVDVVVHAAGRAHVMREAATDPLADFRRVNVCGTLNLARQANLSGVKRFIFLSSIKVNGEQTQSGKPFTEDDLPSPVDPYGVSKYEAEIALLELAAETGMEVVIIRPPLVYGPGVKGNFLSMMRWLYCRIPLPLGAIENQRSLVALDSLVDLIMTCIEHPAAVNEVFLVGDSEDLSTTELIWRMGQVLGRPARLIPVPPWMLQAAANLVGRQSVAQRLCGSLQVDPSKAHKLLGWHPSVSLDQALKKTAEHFLEYRS